MYKYNNQIYNKLENPRWQACPFPCAPLPLFSIEAQSASTESNRGLNGRYYQNFTMRAARDPGLIIYMSIKRRVN